MAKTKIDKDDIKRLVENTSNPTSTTSVYSAKYVEENFLKEITKEAIEEVLTGDITSHEHNYLEIDATATNSDKLDGKEASEFIIPADFETNEVSTPNLSVIWSIKNNNNTIVTLAGMTGQSITLEFGYKPTATQVQGSWSISPSQGVDLPTRIGGLWVSSSPVTPTTPAKLIELTNDSVSTPSKSSDPLTLYAPKKGITVSGTKLILPTGDVSKSTRLTVNYQIPIYYGQVDSQTPTASDILGLFDVDNGMKSCNNNSRKQVINANASSDNYWVYAYPDAWGVLTSISTLDGDMSSAFIQKTVAITRAPGLSLLYRLYITVNKGAFNSKDVTFN